MENLEDEIEYFGFLPITFTTDLQEGLEDALRDVLHRNSPVPGNIRAQIADALRKNIFIFNNFVLRNILKFPQNFRLERKVTDKVIGEDVARLTDAVAAAQHRLADLRALHAALGGRLAAASNRNGGYKALLRNREGYAGMVAAAAEMRRFMAETAEIYDAFRINSSRREHDFENLMEFKNIKNIYYKEEKDRLYGIANSDVLEHYNKL